MFHTLSIKHKIYLAFSLLISSVIVTALVNSYSSTQFNKQVQETTQIIEAFNLASQEIQSHGYQSRLLLEQFDVLSIESIKTQLSHHSNRIHMITQTMITTETQHNIEQKYDDSYGDLIPLLQSIIQLNQSMQQDFDLLSKEIPAYTGNGSIYDARFDSLYDKFTYEIQIAAEQESNRKYKHKLLNARFYIANAHIYLAEFLSASSSEDSEDVLLDLKHVENLLKFNPEKFNKQFKNNFIILFDLAKRRIQSHQVRLQTIQNIKEKMQDSFSMLSDSITRLSEDLVNRDKHQVNAIQTKSNQLELFSILLLISTLIIASIIAYNLVHKLIDSLEFIKASLIKISNEEKINPSKYLTNSNEFNEINTLINIISQHVQNRIKISEHNNIIKNKIETIVNNAHAGLLELNTNGIITSSNNEANLIFSSKPEELIGTNIKDLLNFHSENIVSHSDNELVSPEGKIFNFINKAGINKEIKFSSDMIDDNTIHDAYLIASILDISDLKEAQSELSQQTSLFTSIIHDAPEAIIIVSTERTIQSVNPAFCKLFGYTKDEAEGQSTEFLYSSKSDFIDAGKTRYNPDSSAVSRSFETTYMKKGGTEFISETVGGSIKDNEGKIVGYMAFVRDISHRKEQEKKLQQYSDDIAYNNTRLDIATSSVNLGIWEFDLASNKLFWNTEMFSIFGKNEKGFTNELSEWSESVHPDDLELATQKLNQAIADKSIFKHEFRIIRPDGNVVYLLAHAVVCLNEKADAIRVIGTNWDITEQHLFKKKISDNNQLLSAISLAQQSFIDESSVKKVFDKLLQDILLITNSQYGFICDVDENIEGKDGNPYFKMISASERNNERNLIQDQVSQNNIQALIYNITRHKQTLINNDNSNLNNSLTNLKITNYMGQPFFYGNKLIGIVGIANREEGYDTAVRDFLEPLFRTLGQFSEANRLEKNRKEQNIQLEKLALVASKTKNAVIITDKKGLITWTNDAYQTITEYTLEQSIGQKPGVLLQGKNTDLDTIEHMHNQILNGEGFHVELINYAKSGREYWVSIEAQPITDKNNCVSGFIAVETDITDKRAANEELHDAFAKEKLLALAAQQASITKGEFLANMSHEIRTPYEWRDRHA